MKTKSHYFAALFALALIICLMVIFGPATAMATAATADRNTPTRNGKVVQLTVDNDAVIYSGCLVNVTSNGEAVDAADSTNHTACVGVALEAVDNSDDGETVNVTRGPVRLANGAAFTNADIGDLCYVEDNQTVTTASEATADIPVGRIILVDSDGVWVDLSDK